MVKNNFLTFNLRLIFGLLLLLCIIIISPCVSADNNDILAYQKLKNITRGDNPAGSEKTLALKGDIIKFLVVIQNKTDFYQEFSLDITLPNFTTYIKSSSKYYKQYQGEWRNLNVLNKKKGINDKDSIIFPFNKYPVFLNSKELIYFTYELQVNDLPKGNLLLNNVIKISHQDQDIYQSIVKIFAPNTKIKVKESSLVNNKESSDIKDDLTKLEIKQKEEFDLMEKLFQEKILEIQKDKYISLETKEEKIVLENKKEKDNYQWLVFLFSFLTVVVVLLKLKFLKRK